MEFSPKARSLKIQHLAAVCTSSPANVIFRLGDVMSGSHQIQVSLLLIASNPAQSTTLLSSRDFSTQSPLYLSQWAPPRGKEAPQGDDLPVWTFSPFTYSSIDLPVPS